MWSTVRHNYTGPSFTSDRASDRVKFQGERSRLRHTLCAWVYWVGHGLV
nr:MAG TPA: Alpha conotoxin precursor [Caudoviricetes sp.]